MFSAFLILHVRTLPLGIPGGSKHLDYSLAAELLQLRTNKLLIFLQIFSFFLSLFAANAAKERIFEPGGVS
jgi:hypothetical protein